MVLGGGAFIGLQAHECGVLRKGTLGVLCAQLWPTLCDCGPPGSSVHGILQARTLEWDAMPTSRRSSRPRNWTCISCISCLGSQILYHWATWEAPRNGIIVFIKETWELPCPSCQEGRVKSWPSMNQEKFLCQTPNLPGPWSWTPQLPELWEINFSQFLL